MSTTNSPDDAPVISEKLNGLIKPFLDAGTALESDET
jgi:hypothetical protein